MEINRGYNIWSFAAGIIIAFLLYLIGCEEPVHNAAILIFVYEMIILLKYLKGYDCIIYRWKLYFIEYGVCVIYEILLFLLGCCLGTILAIVLRM